MTFGQWMQTHRRSILFVVALFALGGALTAFRLPTSLFPTVQFPRVVVSLDAGDRPAEQMATVVTTPVEEAVRRVPGVKSLQSTSSRGNALVSVNFEWGTDMAQATLQVQAAIGSILSKLPAGTAMDVKRMDPTVFPIIGYSLTSKTESQTALYELAQYQIRPLLSSVAGVASIDVTGGAQQEYHVSIDPARLAAYKLSLADVARAIGANNVLAAGGRIEDHYKLYLVITNTSFATLDDVKNVMIASGPAMLRLSDIATVTAGTVPRWTRVSADGQDAVLVNVFQQPGGNSVQIAKDVRAKLAAFAKDMPKGVKVANWYDQSVLVTESARSVQDAILIGVVLAAITLFVFLRNWKITIIAVALVPVAMASTVLLLDVLGMGFNIMTLGGMAAAVGLVIDDAIVMIEHIVRRMREGGASSFHGRVMAAALEFTRPLTGSSAATLIIFVPLAFLTGVTGAFFKALSITMASALLVSFLVTWLAIPILCDRWLKPKDAEEKPAHGAGAWLARHYHQTLTRVSDRPWWLLAGLVPLVAAGAFAFTQVGSGFMPEMDEGGFSIDYRTPPGTSLTETDRLLREVEAIIRANPNVETYSRRTGVGLAGEFSAPNRGDFFIRLKAGDRPPSDVVMEQIRARIEREVPGVQIELFQLMEDLIGDLTAVPQPIQIKIFSDDPKVLEATARKTAAAVGKVSGVVDVKDGLNPAGDALEVRVRPDAATAEGMDPAAVSQAVSDMLEGNVPTEFQRGPQMIGVRVRVDGASTMTDTELSNLLLRAPDGHMFPVRRVADIVPVSGQPEITRDNLKRMVAVTARISGRDLGSTVGDVRNAIDAQQLMPAGVYYELGGLYQQQQIAFKGLMAVFGAAIALVFALLLFLYERFRIAIAVMAMPLLASGAVFVGLWMTGIELNISAMMGMTMIIGIVTEVAIFYVSEFQELVREQGMEPREALIEAGRNRLRPIAMTTIAAILALLPLAFALGQGSAMQQPLAIAIIAGLIVQLPLVLLVLPVLLRLLFAKQWDAA
ncbi:MAG: efflux RND transporter permease subunit [Betaproteobacteria bacterium]|nr:efflux RND transporter permease subunit [Betaproteobacteria bacterium]